MRSTRTSSSRRSSSAMPPPRPGRVPASSRNSIPPTCRTYAVRRRQGQCAARRGRLCPRGDDGTRFRLKLLPAPLFQRDQAVRRLSSAGAGEDRHRCRDRQQRLRRAPEGGLHATTISTLRWRRRCFAATRRSRPRSWSKAACRPACPSPTRAATANAELDAVIAKAGGDPRRRANGSALYKRVPATGRGRPAADQRRRNGASSPWPATACTTSPTIRAGRSPTGRTRGLTRRRPARLRRCA